LSFILNRDFKDEIVAYFTRFGECNTRRVCHIHKNSGNPCVPRVSADIFASKVLQYPFNVSKISDILTYDTLG